MDQFRTIKEIHSAFERKEISPTELTKDFFKKIHSSKINAFITLCEDRALKQAQDAEKVLANEKKIPSDKPLLGIPLGIKDILNIDGVRTTCGSKMLDNYISPYTATAVTRLEAAGAITLGKTNMDEFAMGSSNENSAYGVVNNPVKNDRVAGGSSGGSAAAVKAGLCVASLGTDTGGSIRLPASFCGVVGLKPTYGRVSRFGLIAFASSLDQIGPMTHSVDDAARILSVMSGYDPEDSTSLESGFVDATTGEPLSWKGVRIGVPEEYFIEGIQADVDKKVRGVLSSLEKQGAKLVPISLPHTKYAVSVYYLVAVSEASSNLARYDGVRYGVRPQEAVDADNPADFYKKVRANFGPEVKRRILLGTFALSSGYYDAYYNRACQVRALIRRDFDEAFKKVDIIMSPVSPNTAFKIGTKIRDPLEMYLNDILTIPASLGGLPAVSIPCGEDSAGLPIGLQMIAPILEDEKLLRFASAFERGGQQ